MDMISKHQVGQIEKKPAKLDTIEQTITIENELLLLTITWLLLVRNWSMQTMHNTIKSS